MQSPRKRAMLAWRRPYIMAASCMGRHRVRMHSAYAGASWAEVAVPPVEAAEIAPGSKVEDKPLIQAETPGVPHLLQLPHGAPRQLQIFGEAHSFCNNQDKLMGQLQHRYNWGQIKWRRKEEMGASLPTSSAL